MVHGDPFAKFHHNLSITNGQTYHIMSMFAAELVMSIVRLCVSVTGDPETKAFTARASIWLPISYQAQWSWEHWSCHGKWVREICIFGVGDLPWLYRRPELFVNKFYAEHEPLAYDCMEELIYNRTVMQAADHAHLDPTYLSHYESTTFDPTYYLKLPFVSDKAKLVMSLREALRNLV